MNRRPDQRKRNQLFVLRDFIKYLKNSDLTGFSTSSLLETVFTGYWRAQPSEEFDEENVVLLIIDHPLDKNNPVLWKFLAQMRREIQRLYRRYAGAQEKDIWIVVHSIDRLV